MRWIAPVLAAVTLVACAVATAGGAAAATRVPRLPAGFIGVNADGPLLDDPSVDADREFGRIRGLGVGQLRAVIDWAAAQPSGPGSTDLARSDVLVGAAARRGLTVLPVVIHSPAWAASAPGGYAAPPRDPAQYAAFLTALARRYGPAGSFWTQNAGIPRRPIRAWQIWNEPNIPRFWSRQPFARSYAALLRAADSAVHAADAGAKVLTAGLTNGVGSPAWTALEQLYRAGAGGRFDVIAVHPYTGRPSRVIETIRRVRAAARRHGGARTPIALTELSWSSGGGMRKGVTWDTTEAGQARMLTAVFTQIARYRLSLGITSASWYTWLSPAPAARQGWEYFAGLNRITGGKVVAKPALAALRTTIRRLAAGT